jgi:membrane-associated phospholipid phosphatase
METISNIDLSILLWINRLARHSYFFDQSVEVLLGLDFLQGGFFFIFLWWLWFRQSDRPSNDRIDAIRIFITVWFTIVIARALQIGLPYHRARPINDPVVPFVPPYASETGVPEHWSSFPSDHAAVFFALATAIFARCRWLGAIAYVWVFLFACMSRVYAGYHYPVDVLVGAIIGIALMWVVDAVPLPRTATWFTDRVIAWERRNTAAFYCVAVALTIESMDLFNDVRVVGRGLLRALS